MPNKSLRITFILPFVNLTGGIKILFEHANRLVQRGHRVTIIYPGKLFHGENFEQTNTSFRWRYIETPLRRLKYRLFVELLRKTDASWFPLDSRIKLKRTPDLSNKYIPKADVVIATAPETVPWVNDYTPDKGTRVHFAQDYEVWYLPKSFVDATFTKTTMHLITIGSWQKKFYEEEFGRNVEAIIPDGVDTTRFRPDKVIEDRSGKPTRILLSYHHAEYKGIPDGLIAIKKVQEAGYKIQIVMFGVHPLKANLPKEIEYHHNIAEAELPNLYRSCDIFLWPTHREGFGLPPLEAMACGVPVVATATGAVPDYIDDGKTGFIVPIKQPDKLAEKLLVLLKNPEGRQAIGVAAAKAAKNWDWEIQTTKLEQYLLSLVAKDEK